MTTNTCTKAGPRNITRVPPLRDPVFVGVADVMFGTAAAAPARPTRWFDSLGTLYNALLEARSGRRSKPVLRGDYLESAAMAREMHRL